MKNNKGCDASGWILRSLTKCLDNYFIYNSSNKCFYDKNEQFNITFVHV